MHFCSHCSCRSVKRYLKLTVIHLAEFEDSVRRKKAIEGCQFSYFFFFFLMSSLFQNGYLKSMVFFLFKYIYVVNLNFFLQFNLMDCLMLKLSTFIYFSCSLFVFFFVLQTSTISFF